ncbi:hypothetical protein CEXT_96821 [Caerostris extrusa]|uniref:Uncharacterized protein n=1 Tax=Caerostris extrusa TaxID=172846 RepID=A0AAV4NNJ4_CAEEX|nr:hypothetical protein CEXT_96821 [Caerostris extrusa]
MRKPGNREAASHCLRLLGLNCRINGSWILDPLNQNSQCNQFLPSMKIFMDDLKAPPSGKGTHSSSSRCLRGPAYPQLDPSDTPSLLNNKIEPQDHLETSLFLFPLAAN